MIEKFADRVARQRRELAEKTRVVLEMREQGRTYGQIGEELGFSAERARQIHLVAKRANASHSHKPD